MAKQELTLKVSVMDCEPVSELVDIIIGFPRKDTPKELREQIEAWCDKHTTEND